jgi:hypothetical protein
MALSGKTSLLTTAAGSTLLRSDRTSCAGTSGSSNTHVPFISNLHRPETNKLRETSVRLCKGELRKELFGESGFFSRKWKQVVSGKWTIPLINRFDVEEAESCWINSPEVRISLQRWCKC